MMEKSSCRICGNTKRLRNTPIGLLCGRHSNQYYKYGKVLERSKNEPNEILDNGDGTSKIMLYSRYHDVIGFGLIDNPDLEIAKRHKWSRDPNGYLQTIVKKDGRQTILRLHRLLLQNPIGVVDHINGNTSDNRRCNLRVCSRAENVRHRIQRSKSNPKGVIGVSQHKNGKWQSRICINGKMIHLGYFFNIEDAIEARIKAERHYFKEYSPNNN